MAKLCRNFFCPDFTINLERRVESVKSVLVIVTLN